METIFILGNRPGGYLSLRDAQSPDDPLLLVGPAEVFLQLCTSGTTGMPNDVQITHAASILMRSVEVGTGGDWTHWGAQDNVIVVIPDFHVGGTSRSLQWFARGATCVVQVQVDSNSMLDAIDQEGIAHPFTVPTVLSMMPADPRCSQRDFSRLQMIHYGASVIFPPNLIDCIKSFGTGFVQYHGMTKTNGVVSVLQPHEHDLNDPERLKSGVRPATGPLVHRGQPADVRHQGRCHRPGA